jgi:hypothetical protein
MEYKIIESDDKTFYNLLSIDKDGNQTVVFTDKDLEKVQNHKHGKGLQPIPEEQTRGTITE